MIIKAKPKQSAMGIKGFYSRSEQCDACKMHIDEDWPLFFYRVADMTLCEECHDDYIYNMTLQQESNSNNS